MNTTDPIDLPSAAQMALTQMEQADKQYRDDPEWQAALSALRAACGAPTVPPKVWTLVIDNDEGLQSSVHTTKELADAALYDYVKENWVGRVLTKLGPLPKVSAPQDADATVEAYFEMDGQDDRAEITECEVEG